jgi:hypothetical protein
MDHQGNGADDVAVSPLAEARSELLPQMSKEK